MTPFQYVLGIDPGNVESAYALIDSDRRPLYFGKVANEVLLEHLRSPLGHDGTGLWSWNDADPGDHVTIEMIASYGMSVGAEVFETVYWIGRFDQALRDHRFRDPGRVKRGPVKQHHCHSPKANDATVKQALVDRFAAGERNYGKGTKAEPGWFYGFAKDVWAAYAVAVWKADQLDGQSSW